MNKRIFLASPHMSEEGFELEYINDAFSKNWIAPLGENVNEFENAVKQFTGAENAVALSAGTAALHLSMILAGVGRGDTVFCQDLTFSASANPVAYVGAEAVYIDSEPETWNMDPKALKKAFELYGKPKAVVVVHLYGTPAKLDEISGLCAEYGVPLIEDAAEALGSEYRGRRCGTFGAFGALSFNGNKIITTSGGGMLLCRDGEDAKHALKLATQAREPFPWYQHEEIGYNYRLSNISAGIGRGQMKVLEKRVQRKREIFDIYSRELAGLPLTMSPCLEDTKPNRWLSVALLEEGCGVSPTEVIEALQKENIESRHVWKPMHLQPVFAHCRFVKCGEKAVGEELFSRGVCLPSDTKLSDGELLRVAEVIRGLF
ncbi:MAG: aminotransferase class I/II-fold pyridoxal phosphate-dependent enzyme [Oscillospiraceae bacterium]|nr:aminotransferase class I/II-fold pyridoxal phosphate-dependent enzyme [Oscillospiraceae bacterium]